MPAYEPSRRLVAIESRLHRMEEQFQLLISWQQKVASAATAFPWPLLSEGTDQNPSPPRTPPQPARSSANTLQDYFHNDTTKAKSTLRDGGHKITSKKVCVSGLGKIGSQGNGQLQGQCLSTKTLASLNLDILETSTPDTLQASAAIVVDVCDKSLVTLGIDENDPSLRLSSRILDIMSSFAQHLQSESQNVGSPSIWLGKGYFIERVRQQVQCEESIKMILPSFPWKSINTTDKVNGRLPDLGEVLALARLNSICLAIDEIYQHGSELVIATDGLVFDDIVGIPDQDTWAYSRALLDIIVQKGFTGIKIARVPELLELHGDSNDREIYMSLATQCRAVLLKQYGRTEDDIRRLIQTESDSLLTYRGFVRFLEKDLRYSPICRDAPSGAEYRRRVKRIATNMMIRAESFTKLIAAQRPKHVRLSVHPSTGIDKLSIPLILTSDGQFPRTPWHCVLGISVTGSISTVHLQDVRETHTLIYHKGQPYYWREKSYLWNPFNPDVIMFEPEFPTTLLIYPKNETEVLSLSTAQVDNLRTLISVYKGQVVLSRFDNSEKVYEPREPAWEDSIHSAETDLAPMRRNSQLKPDISDLQ